MKKVIVVAGPTAVGKSDFAIEIAKRYGLEIISGDSIQVYRGLDIGSGKVTEDWKLLRSQFRLLNMTKILKR